MSFEDRYNKISILGCGMSGIVYLVNDKQTNTNVAAKLTRFIDSTEKTYKIVADLELLCFLNPIDWYYTTSYPKNYEKIEINDKFDDDDDDEFDVYMIYTMPLYNELQPPFSIDDVKLLLKEYAILQAKTGFCHGDILGNIMYGKLNDGITNGLMVIDFDESFFINNVESQLYDSQCLINTFLDYTNISSELLDFLNKLEPLHSSEWNI